MTPHPPGWSGGPLKDSPRARFWWLVVAGAALAAAIAVVTWVVAS